MFCFGNVNDLGRNRTATYGYLEQCGFPLEEKNLTFIDVDIYICIRMVDDIIYRQQITIGFVGHK